MDLILGLRRRLKMDEVYVTQQLKKLYDLAAWTLTDYEEKRATETDLYIALVDIQNGLIELIN